MCHILFWTQRRITQKSLPLESVHSSEERKKVNIIGLLFCRLEGVSARGKWMRARGEWWWSMQQF